MDLTGNHIQMETQMDFTPQESEVWNTVQALNKVWTVDGDTSKLVNYFHETMVAITPVSNERVYGRDACIAGWKSFTDAATIHYWKELEPLVQIYQEGNCAVVTYYYDMSVDMGGMTMQLKGRDMMTFIKEEGKWWLVSDQFSSFPMASKD